MALRVQFSIASESAALLDCEEHLASRAGSAFVLLVLLEIDANLKNCFYP